jgi:hypothetical protein
VVPTMVAGSPPPPPPPPMSQAPPGYSPSPGTSFATRSPTQGFQPPPYALPPPYAVRSSPQSLYQPPPTFGQFTQNGSFGGMAPLPPPPPPPPPPPAQS